MFCIRKTLYSEKLNVFLYLRLFDACVKPILLYCSEIWSLDILIKRNLNFESKYVVAFIVHNERGNKPSSDNTAIFVADL
jgi:hypothetical protein